MRWVLGLEYDGGPFCGWQTQLHGQSVQDTLEQALAQVAGERLKTVAAGRTDAKVHALLQVVHFDCAPTRPMTAWVRGVNRYLPPTVRVLWAQAVDLSFHARFSACARHYCYFLSTHRVAPALLAGKVGWFHKTLDLAMMRKAADLMLGQHDFSCFRAASCQATSPIKHLYCLNLTEQQGLLRFDLSANAFLHHMVRNIVGTLVYVGKGALSVAECAALLASRSRRQAPPTFMPDGLYFAGVDYPAAFSLPTQLEPGYRVLI